MDTADTNINKDGNVDSAIIKSPPLLPRTESQNGPVTDLVIDDKDRCNEGFKPSIRRPSTMCIQPRGSRKKRRSFLVVNYGKEAMADQLVSSSSPSQMLTTNQYYKDLQQGVIKTSVLNRKDSGVGEDIKHGELQQLDEEISEKESCDQCDFPDAGTQLENDRYTGSNPIIQQTNGQRDVRSDKHHDHFKTTRRMGITDDAQLKTLLTTDSTSAINLKQAMKEAQDERIAVYNIIKRGKLLARRKRNRIIMKNGEVNISKAHVEQRSRRYLVDFFTTLLEMKWRYNILILVLAFIVSWLLFALIWWGLNANETVESPNPCVEGVYSFTSAFLFSIETQQTIGYGTRAVTENCPVAVIFVMIQSIIGLLIQCIITGLIFAKLARPKRRSQTVMFSKRAVICTHEGQRCLMIRIGDLRKSHLIGVNVNAIMLKSIKRESGKEPSFEQCKMQMMCETDDFFFLAWPLRAIHIIDENSPLWDISEDELYEQHFEVIVVLEGTSEVNGMSMQLRTSYLPSEILWGYVFSPLLTCKEGDGELNIDYTRFDKVDNIELGSESAEELKKFNGITKCIKRPLSRVQFSDDDDESIFTVF